MDADDVLATTRQAELEDLAKRFLEFHPTAIAIEKSRHTESARDYTFGEFTPADLSKDRDEIVQIRYRLALTLNYGWFARNAEIFSNIIEFAEPGGRIIVISGSGTITGYATLRRRRPASNFRTRAVSHGLADRKRVIIEDWREPAFCFANIPSLTPGIVLNLIFLDPSDGEINAVRMGQIETGDTGRRGHRKAAGK